MHYHFSLFSIIKQQFLNDHDRWVLWWPVGMGLGIALYFSLLKEPSLVYTLGFLSAFAILFLRCRRGKYLWIACLSIALGFSCAKVRTMVAHTIMLGDNLTNITLEGIVQSVEYRHGHWRYVIDQVYIPPFVHPLKIRINDRNRDHLIVPDMKIRFSADLMPWPSPVSPTGYDARRAAYFQGLAATGRLKHLFSSASSLQGEGVKSLRYRINQYFLTHLSYQCAPLAMTLVTGEKGMIPDELRTQFTDAGLAHLLAISGLHFGVVVGLLFFLIRSLLTVLPWIGERWSLKKISALLSLPLAATYLALSGFGVPAQRAFIMIAIFMIALLWDRQALSMRSVGLAATLILGIYPENLLNASFQLSFAAVIGLVACYEMGRNFFGNPKGEQDMLHVVKRYLIGILFTSMIASLATLPFTIHIFNKFTLISVLANMVAVPFMGLVIIPFLLIVLFCAPFGEIGWITQGAQWSLESLIHWAILCSQLPGAVVEVSTPHPGFIALITLGGLWFCLWHQPWRYAGLGALVLAPFMLFITHHPILYATSQGLALVDEQSQTLQISLRKPSTFLSQQWQRDWVGYSKDIVMGKIHLSHDMLVVFPPLSFKSISFICQQQYLIVTPVFLSCRKRPKDYPKVIDRSEILKQGALFIWADHTIQGMRDLMGDRPWGTKA